MKAAISPRTAGFSMVEVALALGLVAFCLVAVFGLLPVGFGAVKASNDEAAAVNLLEQISESIREAAPEAPPLTDTYSARGAYKRLTWSLGGDAVAATFADLSTSGFPTPEENAQRFTARIELTPPADRSSAGTALVSVAWPVHADWDNDDSHWRNNEGAVETWLVFLPKMP